MSSYINRNFQKVPLKKQNVKKKKNVVIWSCAYGHLRGVMEKFETKDINTTQLLLLLLKHGMVEICHLVEMLCLRSNHYGFFPKFACVHSGISCTKYNSLWNSGTFSPVRKNKRHEKSTKNCPKMTKVEPS